MSEPSPPSSFFAAQSERLCAAARRGPVVDLACGRGRHTLAAAEIGARAVGIDRSRAFLDELGAAARARDLALDRVQADLEVAHGIPLAPGSCGAILVFRFLHRPLADALAAALAPGGLLLYETFTIHQRELGHGPRNPAFLLAEGELLELFRGLEVLDYWEGVTGDPRPQALARLAARRRA